MGVVSPPGTSPGRKPAHVQLDYAMKLILVSTPYFFVEEHPIITALFDEGLDFLHLRKPDSEPIYCERLLSLLPKKTYKRIVVHDHYYLKNEYSLWGIHLARKKEIPLNYKGHVTCSCRTIDELKNLKPKCDYVIFNPAIDSEPSQQPLFGPENIARYAAEKTIDKRVMAMGNIDLDDIEGIGDAGFGGAVLFGSIWNRFDVHSTQDFKELISHFRKIRKAAG